jgi:hypothetical protein
MFYKSLIGKSQTSTICCVWEKIHECIFSSSYANSDLRMYDQY